MARAAEGSGGGGGGGGGEEREPGQGVPNALGPWVQRKSARVQTQLDALGTEQLELTLQEAPARPAQPPFALAFATEAAYTQMRPIVVAEVSRTLLKDGEEGAEGLVALANRLVDAGADAIAVYVDEHEYDAQPGDLAAVATAMRARETPVLMRDLVIHPLQLAECVAAGAHAATLVNCVLNNGLPIMLRFGNALGMDNPVEVCNLTELQQADEAGAPWIALNVNVGINVPVPGFGSEVAAALVKEVPEGTGSFVGVRSLAEAKEMHAAGAAALLVKRDAYVLAQSPEALIEAIRYAVSGDD